MIFLKRILIIHTGGTISMLENKQTGEVTTTVDHPLMNVSAHFKAVADVDEIIAFQLPSPQITPKHMLDLAKLIDQKSDLYDGIVVTHGTDTLEETAYFLNLVVQTNKPIILTGAMRSSNEIGSDALYNLLSSLRVAVEDDAAGKGVLVVMNDEIHTADNVTKTSTSNVATFQSPQYGPIGIITKDSIIFHHTIITREFFPVKTIIKTVILLKAYAGMDSQLIDAVANLKPDGVVVEGLGQGNLPKEVIPSLQTMIAEEIPVALVSRCYQGIVQPTYSYDGGGKQLKDMGIIFAKGLNGPKARIKLLLALEQQQHDLDTLKRCFEQK